MDKEKIQEGVRLILEGIGVLIEAEHMCMTMRGIKKPGTKTVTVVTRGVFNEDEKLQNQFYRMLERR